MADYLKDMPPPPAVIYRRAPLSEVVQEFTFRPETVRWHEGFWSEFATELGTEFPLSDHGHIQIIDRDPHTGGRPQDPLAVCRYSTESGGIVLTVGPGVLGVSVRPPRLSEGYPGWDTVHESALRLLTLYERITGAQTVDQAVVRYINRIAVIPGSFRLSNFVDPGSPLVPTALLQQVNPFSLELTHAIGADEWEIRTEIVRLSAGTNEEGANELLLQIDEIAHALTGYDLRDIKASCAALHAAAHVAFGSVFSEAVRQSFEPSHSSSPRDTSALAFQ